MCRAKADITITPLSFLQNVPHIAELRLAISAMEDEVNQTVEALALIHNRVVNNDKIDYVAQQI